MKYTLLITSPRSERWLESNSQIAKGLIDFAHDVSDDDMSLCVTSLDRLEFFVSNDKLRIWDNYNSKDLADFDMVHLRNIDKKIAILDYARAIVCYVHRSGGKMLEESDYGLAIGKLSQMMLFADQQLPIPQTLSSWSNSSLLVNALEHLSFPMIVKANNAMKGADNHLIHNEKELRSVLEGSTQQYVAQEYIPNDGDFRVLLGGKGETPLIFKRLSNDDSHLNNTSKGAQAELHSVSDMGESVMAIVTEAAQAVGRTFTGVDVMQDSHSGSWVLLEANVNPALSMGAFLDEKVELYRQMIKNIAGDKK